MTKKKSTATGAPTASAHGGHTTSGVTATGAAIHPVETIQLIPLDAITQSPFNRRKIPTKPTADMRELANSIKENGVVTPCVVRPVNGAYELVFGHRRRAAAILAGLDALPCNVRDLTDAESAAICVLENLQREPLAPLEEAESVDALYGLGWSTEHIANELGMSPQWVQRRMKLVDLTDDWQQAAQNPELPMSRWSASHLELIARLAPEVQERALSQFSRPDAYAMSDVGGLTVSDLRAAIRNVCQSLSSMRWDVDDATLVPEAGTCSTCKKRSDCHEQIGLWDDADFVKPKEPHCLDEVCYRGKETAWAAREMDAFFATNKNGAVVAETHKFVDTPIYERLRRSWEFDPKPVKSDTPGAVLVLDIDTGKKSWRKPSASGAPKPKKPASELTKDERVAKAKMRQVKAMYGYALAAIEGFVDSAMAVNPHESHSGELPQHKIVALAAVFGSDRELKDPGSLTDAGGGVVVEPWRMLDKLLEPFEYAPGPVDRKIFGRLYANTARVIAKRLKANQKASDPERDELDKVCAFFGLPIKEYEQRAYSEKPFPKALQLEVAAAERGATKKKEGTETNENQTRKTTAKGKAKATGGTKRKAKKPKPPVEPSAARGKKTRAKRETATRRRGNRGMK